MKKQVCQPFGYEIPMEIKVSKREVSVGKNRSRSRAQWVWRWGQTGPGPSLETPVNWVILCKGHCLLASGLPVY